MVTHIQKWGNSLAVRIPKSFAEEIHLEQGASVEISLENGKLTIHPVHDTPYTLEGLLAGVTKENIHDEVDTGSPVGNEVC